MNTSNYFLNEQYTLVRAPLDPVTGQPLDKCGYALFPGLALAQSEPELTILLYDSVRNQHPDTAMFLYKGRDGADPLLNRKWAERLLTRWRNLGKPTVFVCTPEDMKYFRGVLTEIPAVSVYDELVACNISGGCNHELYRLSEPSPYGSEPALRKLAEMMGVVLYEAGSAGGSDGTNDMTAAGSGDDTSGTGPAAPAPRIDPADVSKIPFLTSSIDVRNAMKKQGFEAVHILELIYGMGRSNSHLAHTHDGDHDHHAAPGIRNVTMGAEEKAALEELFSPEARRRNLQQLHDTLLAMFWGE